MIYPEYAIDMSDATLADAMGVNLTKFENGKGNWPQEMEGATALVILAMQEHCHPGSEIGGASVAARVAAHIKQVVSGGCEPQLHVGPWWANPAFACAAALAKKTPTVWSLFTEEEIDRLDWVMRGFAVQNNYASNAENNFVTGPELLGNYSKHWNPNFRSSNLVQILACVSYFGSAEAVDEILTGFDYDTYIEVYTKLGYTNIVTNWTKGDIKNGAGFVKRLMETGAGTSDAPFTYLNNEDNTVTGGYGAGVKIPFTYWTDKGIIPLKEVSRVFNTMLIHLYDMTTESAVGEAYIDGHIASPFEGQFGMMHEYNSKDAKGIRSDAGYCTHNFAIMTCATAAVIVLGLWDPREETNRALLANMYVGNEDHIFKMVTGYYSYSHGKLAQKPSLEPDGVTVYGMSKAVWREYLVHFAPQSEK